MSNTLKSTNDLLKKVWPEVIIDTYRSQMAIVVEALKLLALANGGAVVALLNNLGSLMCKAGSSDPLNLSDLIHPISLFAAGLLFCILAFFATYFTQMKLFKHFLDNDKHYDRQHFIWFTITAFTVLLSIGLFLCGAVLSSNEIGKALIMSHGATK